MCKPYRILFVKIRHIYFCDKSLVPRPIGNDLCMKVVAVEKQLGIPAWFMTLSYADLRWPELFQIISRMQGKDITDEEVDALSFQRYLVRDIYGWLVTLGSAP